MYVETYDIQRPTDEARYVGMYVVEGFEHPLSKAQEAVEISYDTKREWLRGMTTDRVWIKDLLGSAGLKVEESSNFTTFVTNLMNKVSTI